MKKHQKFLVGLMILGLAGGVGTAFALSRNAATDINISGQTDGAIYLEWTDNTNETATGDIDGLQANVVKYSPVVVSPKSSKSVTGTVSVTFTLATNTNTELPGLTVDVYKCDSYKEVAATGDTSEKALKIDDSVDGSNTYSTEFDVSAAGENETSHKTTSYYLLGFKWDGTQTSSSDVAFGGKLTISASFSA